MNSKDTERKYCSEDKTDIQTAKASRKRADVLGLSPAELKRRYKMGGESVQKHFREMLGEEEYSMRQSMRAKEKQKKVRKELGEEGYRIRQREIAMKRWHPELKEELMKKDKREWSIGKRLKDIVPEDVKRKHWDEGIATSSIAIAYGVKEAALLAFMNKNNIQERKEEQSMQGEDSANKKDHNELPCKGLLDSEEENYICSNMGNKKEACKVATLARQEIVQKEPLDLDPEEISHQYLDEGMSMKDLAEKHKVSEYRVATFMTQHNIPKRTRQRAQLVKCGFNNVKPEEIHRKYWEEKKTTKQIGNEFNVSDKVVISFMQRNNIPFRSKERTARISHVLDSLDPEEVERKYWKEGLSPKQIADGYGISSYPIVCLMKKRNIPTRNLSQALTTHHQQKANLNQEETIQIAAPSKQKDIKPVTEKVAPTDADIAELQRINDMIPSSDPGYAARQEEYKKVQEEAKEKEENKKAYEAAFEEAEKERKREELKRVFAEAEKPKVEPVPANVSTRAKTIEKLEARKVAKINEVSSIVVKKLDELRSRQEQLLQLQTKYTNEIQGCKEKIQNGSLSTLDKEIEVKKTEMIKLQMRKVVGELAPLELQISENELVERFSDQYLLFYNLIDVIADKSNNEIKSELLSFAENYKKLIEELLNKYERDNIKGSE